MSPQVASRAARPGARSVQAAQTGRLPAAHPVRRGTPTERRVYSEAQAAIFRVAINPSRKTEAGTTASWWVTASPAGFTALALSDEHARRMRASREAASVSPYTEAVGMKTRSEA